MVPADSVLPTRDRWKRRNRLLDLAGAVLLFAIATMGATGCAAATPYKAYAGPDLPDERVAIVTWTSETRRLGIDETPVLDSGQGPQPRSARLLPGTHLVFWEMYVTSIRGRISRSFAVDMQAGHVYELKTWQCSWCSPIRAAMWIEDATSGGVVAGDPRPTAFLSKGRSSYSVPAYGASAANAALLNQAGGRKVAVGTFTAPDSRVDIGCRGADMITTPDQRPFEDYIRKALIDELQLAELYAESGPVILTGVLDKLDFNSMRGGWFLGLTVKSSNGRSVAVAADYDYETSLGAITACSVAARAFGPAVQMLIGKLVSSPDFPELLK